MRLVTFVHPESGEARLGAILHQRIVDLSETHLYRHLIDRTRAGTKRFLMPSSMQEFLEAGEEAMREARDVFEFARSNYHDLPQVGLDRTLWLPMGGARILAPLPHPLRIRDFIAFEAHIKTLREKRGESVPESWYQIPHNYMGNHLNVSGPEDEIEWPSYGDRFDYELELACVIGKKGRNIPEEEAHEYIAGYMIMNDWSCRSAQRLEMQGNLGPSTLSKPGPSFGPYILTADKVPDLAHMREQDKRGPVMRAYVNGKKWSEGRFGSIHWSFAQMIAYVSQADYIYPGEIFGSGTVGTGCGAELDRWIKPGDRVKLSIEGLGALVNQVGISPEEAEERKEG